METTKSLHCGSHRQLKQEKQHASHCFDDHIGFATRHADSGRGTKVRHRTKLQARLGSNGRIIGRSIAQKVRQ